MWQDDHGWLIARPLAPGEDQIFFAGTDISHLKEKVLPPHCRDQALLSAAPDLNVVRGVPPKERIRLVGDVPSPINPPSGCRFRTRCWKAQDICAAQEPVLELKNAAGDPLADEHTIACHLPEVKTDLVAEVLVPDVTR